MPRDAKLAHIAALLGDPARANMMLALMDGRARASKDLAFAARVSPPTASGHLAKLLDGGLVAVLPQGRRRYFRIASPSVARMVEAVAVVAAETEGPGHRLRPDDPMRLARTCYDHLAGRLGVLVADRLQAADHVILTADGGEVTGAGRDFLRALGIDLDRAPHSRRVFCRLCLDWTERRPHLAGALGALVCDRVLASGWVERVRDGRALVITEAGKRTFAERFAIDVDAMVGAPERAAA